MKTKLDYSKIDNIEIDGLYMWDYPDFSDAYICYAEYDGVEMTDDQLDEINEDSQFIYEQIEWKIQ